MRKKITAVNRGTYNSNRNNYNNGNNNIITNGNNDKIKIKQRVNMMILNITGDNDSNRIIIGSSSEK